MKIKILAFTIIYTLSFSSCLKDDLFSDNVFEGPSEYNIEFQSGSFTGSTYKLVSNTASHDHGYLISKGIQKILSEPLQDNILNNLKTNSFVNWAWKGDTIPGQFSAIFATDPTVSTSGNLQLIFTNGDEFISSIPKDSHIEISSFGGPQGAIEGNITFTSELYYSFNGSSNREIAGINIAFKIKRGPNL